MAGSEGVARTGTGRRLGAGGTVEEGEEVGRIGAGLLLLGETGGFGELSFEEIETAGARCGMTREGLSALIFDKGLLNEAGRAEAERA